MVSQFLDRGCILRVERGLGKTGAAAGTSAVAAAVAAAVGYYRGRSNRCTTSTGC